MKRSPLFLLCFFTIIEASAQSAGESKDNTNSILLNGSAITVKITDPAINVDFQRNNLFKKSRNNGYIVGVSAAGKNNNGLSSIFSDGNLVPAGRLTGVAGLTFSNNINTAYSIIRGSYREREEQLRNRLDELNGIRDKLRSEGKPLTDVDKAITDLTKELTDLLQEMSKVASDHSTLSFWKLTVFGTGGINAKSFKRFLKYDSTNLIGSFKNENFKGGFWTLGANFQYRNWVFGATIGSTKDDNQSQLSEQTYNWEKTTALGNQSIKEAKEIKAYGGSYGKVAYTSINADVILNIALEKVSNVEQPRDFMLVNPYVHAKTGSTNSDLLPNTTDVGLGLYLFNTKSKLMGGIYVELPDVGNKIENAKAVVDRNIRPALQKLSVGIVTRLNLQSFFQFQH
jgi:hypothetical protein